VNKTLQWQKQIGTEGNAKEEISLRLSFALQKEYIWF
jgi:hypothetical protein